MNDAITTIYCLCDDFLKVMHHRDDPQARLSTAEVMTLSLWLPPSSAATSTKPAYF